MAAGSEAGAPQEIPISPDSPQLSRIRTATVEARFVPVEQVVAPGRIQAIPTRVFRIAAPVAGRIQRVLVGLGDRVQPGQLLFTLESPEVTTLISAYRQAEARLRQAKANLAKAEADLNRVRDLFEHNAVAQKEVISAQTTFAQAQAEVEQAGAAVQESLGRLALLGLKPDGAEQQISVRAPVSGKILEISVAPGEYRNDTTAPLMTIADLASVHLVAEVPESMIRWIAPGQRVEVTLTAYPGETFVGKVAKISDTVRADTRTIPVLAELPNPSGRLRPDMFGEIRCSGQAQLTPVVPAQALIYREGRVVVWRVKQPGDFEAVEVHIGRPAGEQVPILSGLRPGDRIVVDGAMLLEKGRW